MRKWKIILIMIMFIVLIQTGMSCKERYDINEDVIIIDAISKVAEGAECNITTYNQTNDIVDSSIMNVSGLLYSKNLSKLPKGIYSSSIECNLSSNIYSGECKFDVGVNEKQMIAIMIGLAVCLMFFIYIVYVLNTEFKGIYKQWLAPLKFLFISLAFYMALGIFRIGIELLSDNGKASLSNLFNDIWIILMIVYSFVFFIVMFLFGIRFVWGLVENKKYRGE